LRYDNRVSNIRQSSYNTGMTAKVRLDVLIVQRGLAASQAEAQKMVMAGEVRAAGQVIYNADTRLAGDIPIEIKLGPPYVSRGGDKLAAALQAFSVEVRDRLCADVGASTGGFTDCLLQHGARLVYAIDVGQGILDWKLRQDKRVVVMENTNARLLESLPGPVSLVTMDASFISLTVLLPVVLNWLEPARAESSPPAEIIALVKPQFEASRVQAGRARGVIRDPQVHRQVLERVLAFASQQGCQVKGLLASPLLGPKGNREFLLWLGYPAPVQAEDGFLADLIEEALSKQ
jgi:23S rRNA (cytidine1920-2'-O)/16S rRNA (cytidine1409-2'-O)-methyltransferase